MTNENPKVNRRLEDRLAAAKAGKALQIVVQGNCGVCRRRSASIPATKTQVIAWFGSGDTTGFLKYEIRMLETGQHRACQKVADQKAKAKKAPARAANFHIPLDGDKVERIMARRNKNGGKRNFRNAS